MSCQISQPDLRRPPGSEVDSINEIGGVKVAVSWSSQSEDQPWDKFLQSSALGQFQQSALWAQYKLTEGWQVRRCVLKANNQIIGGAQLLWRRSRGGRIAYISKGPVVAEESESIARHLLGSILKAARDEKIAAMIVQPPDASKQFAALLPPFGFLPNRLKDVIDATLMVDLEKGLSCVEGRMDRITRKEVRQAKRRGVTVREGNSHDVAEFFRMMSSTCRRQGVTPNPASLEATSKLWEVFHPAGARLTIASCRNETVAGMFSIPFGKRYTLWKKGWTGQHKDCHVNSLLHYENLEWACAHGYREVDFVAMNRNVARSVLEGKPLTDEQNRTRDRFHLGFGGTPLLLPESQIWFANPCLRYGYRLIFGRRRSILAT